LVELYSSPLADQLAAVGDEGFELGQVPASKGAELAASGDLACVGESVHSSPRTAKNLARLFCIDEAADTWCGLDID
jgi:hypothetical protein